MATGSPFVGIYQSLPLTFTRLEAFRNISDVMKIVHPLLTVAIFAERFRDSSVYHSYDDIVLFIIPIHSHQSSNVP